MRTAAEVPKELEDPLLGTHSLVLVGKALLEHSLALPKLQNGRTLGDG